MEIQPVYMNTNDMEQFVKVEKTEVKQNVNFFNKSRGRETNSIPNKPRIANAMLVFLFFLHLLV